MAPLGTLGDLGNGRFEVVVAHKSHFAVGDPPVSRLTLREIVAATGLFVNQASRIKRSVQVPRPEHRAALRIPGALLAWGCRDVVELVGRRGRGL